MSDSHPTDRRESAIQERNDTRPRVVIVGAGFGGLTAARALKKAPVRVTIVDRSNHHLFQPLLYQVATAALNPSDISAPIRRILRSQKNAEVLLADVRRIDVERSRVILADGEIPYDFLIVAAGATHSYFGHRDWESDAPGLKTLADALEIRRRILLAFEIAERATDPATRRAYMTFVIVGGGPTGVELAGTLAEVARKTLARDFRHIDPTQAHVILLEGGSRVLSAFVPALSESAKAQLERLGVDVRTGTMVTSVDSKGVSLGAEERIEARTILWAAGIAASPLANSLGVPLDRSGRVLVEPDLSIPGHNNIFVIGDLMHFEQAGRLVPGVAPAAIQSGGLAARNIRRRVQGKSSQPFHYHDKGMLATIGRASGVAQLGRVRFSGLPAWLLWLFVHIVFLIGFRNRLLVLIQWAWSYVTYDRGARLITATAEGPLTEGLNSTPLRSAEEAGVDSC